MPSYSDLVRNTVLLSGIVVSGWMQGWHGILQSSCGIATGALIFGTLFCMRGRGMGDVKLCAAIGAWIGPGQLFTAIVLTEFFGGLILGDEHDPSRVHNWRDYSWEDLEKES